MEHAGIAKKILRGRGSSNETSLRDIKMYYKATEIKRVRVQHTNKQTDRWNRMKFENRLKNIQENSIK